MRRLVAAACLCLTACAGTAASSPPVSPAPVQGAQPPPTDHPGAQPPDPLAGVPAPPAACDALGQHQPVPSPESCGDRATLLAAFDRALAEPGAEARDAALTALQVCAEFPAGVVLALRAELAPVECADVLIGESAQGQRAELGQPLAETLNGLGLAAKLARLVRVPPTVEPPYTKARVDAFIKGTMGEWVVAQARAIGELALRGSRLGGYGKGIAAIEAGMADMRFVDAFRRVPLPEEFAQDDALRDAYYSSLDLGLEPRKTRGRDAALVGLRALAEAGVLRDPRVDRARALLSELYNGRRIDALDALVLPPLPPLDQSTVERRLAARLPTFYADLVLGPADPNDPLLLRALLERGLPPWVRTQLDQSALGADVWPLYARGLFELGRTYWRADDFARARSIAAAPGKPIAEARLLSALGAALERGPKDAAAMMLQGAAPQGVGDVSELDALTRTQGPFAGTAAYDAAFILELVPPRSPDAKHFEDIAARYDRAALLLRDAALKKLARERAKAARATMHSLP
jgi:hypothetical protein